MTQHTPGPWHVVSKIVDVEGTRLYVAEVTLYGNYRGEVCRLQSCDHIRDGISRTEAEANARLIAAAPDLLAALDDLRAILCDPAGNPVFQGSDGDHGVARRAFAAIAKARGEG